MQNVRLGYKEVAGSDYCTRLQQKFRITNEPKSFCCVGSRVEYFSSSVIISENLFFGKSVELCQVGFAICNVQFSRCNL